MTRLLHFFWSPASKRINVSLTIYHRPFVSSPVRFQDSRLQMSFNRVASISGFISSIRLLPKEGALLDIFSTCKGDGRLCHPDRGIRSLSLLLSIKRSGEQPSSHITSWAFSLVFSSSSGRRKETLNKMWRKRPTTDIKGLELLGQHPTCRHPQSHSCSHSRVLDNL